MSKHDLGSLPFPALALGVLMIAAAGCHSNPPPDTNQAQNAAAIQAADESQDPAEQANLAPAVETTPPPASDQNYAYNAPESANQVTYAPGPPPPLPDYEQPEAPDPDYIWTPGYWNYANSGYYWVPGTWVLAPYTGALWTPGYWGFYNGRYTWHHGYWGPHVGFYGGVNYGHGYTGVGYVGGYWDNGSFRYNTAITRVNRGAIHNTYSHRVRVVTNPRVSYNGGRGGLSARPLTSERVASHERHMGPLPAQQQHRQQASQNRAQWASQNHGHPKTAAASQPLNAGRHAPDSMPPAVREQVQRERQGHAPATEPRSAHRENQNGSRQTNRNQARPATHPEAGRSQPGGTTAHPENRQARTGEAQQSRQQDQSQQQRTTQHQQRRDQPDNTEQNPHP